MNNNRCWFRARISHDKIFKQNTIDIEMSDFYGCLRDSVKKPMSMRLRMDAQLNNYCSITNEEIANYYTKDCMHQLRQTIIKQAEQFFEEFYHYNFDDMKRTIKECIEMKDIK